MNRNNTREMNRSGTEYEQEQELENEQKWNRI